MTGESAASSQSRSCAICGIADTDEPLIRDGDRRVCHDGAGCDARQFGAVVLPLSLSQRPCKRCGGSYGICFHPDDCDKKETP